MYFFYILIPFILIPYFRIGNICYGKIIYHYSKEQYSLVVIIMLFIYLILKKKINIKKIITFFNISMFSYLGILILGHFYAVDKISGGRTVIGFSMFLLLYLSVYFMRYDRKGIIYGLVVSGLFQALIGIIQSIGDIYYKIMPVGFPGYSRAKIIGTIGHVNQYSHFLSIIFVLAISFLFFERNKPRKIFLIISSGIIFYSILITQTRASWLAIFVMVFFFLYKGRKLIFRKSNRKYFVLMSLILIFDLVIFLQPHYKQAKSRIEGCIARKDGSTNERYIIWAKALMFIKQKPIFGVGTGGFLSYELATKKAYDQTIKNNQNAFKENRTFYNRLFRLYGHVHNEYLQALVENGIIGFIPIVLMLFALVYELHKSKKYLKLITFLPIGAVMIISIFSFPMHMVHNFTLAAICLGLYRQV